MQMQEQQAELEASLQQKQLEVMQAADQFQPVITNLEKVCVMFGCSLYGVQADVLCVMTAGASGQQTLGNKASPW